MITASSMYVHNHQFSELFQGSSELFQGSSALTVHYC